MVQDRQTPRNYDYQALQDITKTTHLPGTHAYSARNLPLSPVEIMIFKLKGIMDYTPEKKTTVLELIPSVSSSSRIAPTIMSCATTAAYLFYIFIYIIAKKAKRTHCKILLLIH